MSSGNSNDAYELKFVPYKYEMLERLLLQRNGCAELHHCVNRQEQIAKSGKQPAPEPACIYAIDGKTYQGFIIWMEKTPEWFTATSIEHKRVIVRIGDYDVGFKTITIIAE